MPCFVDTSDLLRQITPLCVNHFVKVNQAVFHNSFRPLGFKLICYSNNLLLSGVLGNCLLIGRCVHEVIRRKRSRRLSAPVFLCSRVQRGKVQALGLEGGKLGFVFLL